MRSDKLLKTYFILSLICYTNLSFAAFAKDMTVVGEIVSFDQTHVKIKSGKQVYIFSKSELDHPNYIVGNKIEIPFDENRMKQAKIKTVKK